jgi:hypothetical protein
MPAAAVSSHSIVSETAIEAVPGLVSAAVADAPRGAFMSGAVPLLVAAGLAGAALWALLSWAMA